MSDLLTNRALAAQPHAVLAASVADGAAEIKRLTRDRERLDHCLERGLLLLVPGTFGGAIRGALINTREDIDREMEGAK